MRSATSPTTSRRVRCAASQANVVTQGVEVATGLQKAFDWAGVAAAGIGGGVTSAVDDAMPVYDQMDSSLSTGVNTLSQVGSTFATDAVGGMAGLIASSATRSLINGTDFGDNILKGLPDAIGQTIGNAIAGGIEGPDGGATNIQQAGKTSSGSLLDPNNGGWTSEGTTGVAIHNSPVEVSNLPDVTDPNIETVVVTGMAANNIVPTFNPADLIIQLPQISIGVPISDVHANTQGKAQR